MKRPKAYSHRPGMRFDRRHVQGPDASFLGTGIDVVSITGSVMESVQQTYHSYSLSTSSLFIGYPRTFTDLYEITNEPIGAWFRGCGVGFDAGGNTNYASLFTANGGGSGIDTWTFYPFRQSFPPDPNYYDFGGSWKATTKYWGVPTFITASSFEASPGPRGQMDLGVNAPVSGVAVDVDYSLRLMTTSSFLYTSFDGGTWFGSDRTSAVILVFRYTDITASFDIHSFGRLDHEGWSTSLSMVTGNLRFAVTGSTQTYRSISVPVDPDKWYIALSSTANSYFGRDFTSIGVIPFWGGTVVTSSLFGSAGSAAFGTPSNVTASYIGDCGVFRASSAFHLAALYMGPAVFPFGINVVGTPANGITPVLPVLQQVFSSQNRTKYSSNSAIDDSLGTFGTSLESRYLNQKLLGLGTGGLGRSFGVVQFVTGTQPSWTNSHIRNSAFISTTLSSSNHESQVLNYYLSGTEILESTAIPASVPLYYVKTGSYKGNTLTRKYGTSTGIAFLTGTQGAGNFAVLYRVTGTLAVISGTNPGWLFNNQFSMPVIPLSSASLVETTAEPVFSVHPSDLLAVRPILGDSQRLPDAARDAFPPQTRAQYAAEVVTGSLT